MALDPKVRAIIEILLKDKGTKDAVAGMARGKAGADKMTASLKRTETQASKLGQTLTRFLGAAVLGRFAFVATSEFADLERRIGALRIQMENLGLAAADVDTKILPFLESLEASTGQLRQETLPAFQKLIGVTQDTGAALAVMNVASQAVTAGAGSFQTVLERLLNVMQGEALEAAKQLGVRLDFVGGRAQSNGEILQAVAEHFRGMNARIQDTQADLEKAGAVWNDFKLAVGGAIAFIGPPVFKFFQSLGPLALKAFTWVKEGGAAMAGTLRVALNPANWFGGVDVGATIQAIWKGHMAQVASVQKDVQAELEAIWSEGGQDGGEAYAEGLQKAVDQANQRTADRQAKEADQRAEKQRELEQKAQDQLLAMQIAAAKEGSEERLQLELRSLERARELALAQEEITAEARAAIHRRFDLAREQAIREHGERRLEAARQTSRDLGAEFEAMVQAEEQAFEQLLEQQIAMQQEGSEERLQLELQRLEREREAALEQEKLTEAAKLAIRETFRLKAVQLEEETSQRIIAQAREEAARKRDFALQAAQDGIAAAQTLFGHHKVLAIAAATMDAYRAINSVLADPTLPYFAKIAAAASIAAQAFANVRAIEGTQLGGGGGRRGGFGRGGGGGTRASRLAARAEFAGLSEKARTGGASSSVTNVDSRSSVTVNLQGPVLLDRQGERRLARIVERAQRRDRARRIR